MGITREKALAAWLTATMIGGMASVAAADTIKIGLVGPLTGPAANTGLTYRATYELAAEQINKAGGIAIDGANRQIELIFSDSQSKPSVGVSAAQRLLTRDSVDLLVGDLLHSDVTLAIMELAPAFPKVFYVPVPVAGAIADRIEAEPEKYGNVWKWNGDAAGYGISIASFLTEAIESGARDFPNKTVAFIGEETEYARSVSAAVEAEVVNAGWTIAVVENVALGHADFFPQLSKLRSINADLVISNFTAPNSGLAFIKQAKEQGLASQQLAIHYPGLPGFQSGIDDEADGLVYFATLMDASRTERGRAFAEMLEGTGIAVDTNAALGYCSANTLFDAIRAAGSLETEALNAALLATDSDKCPNYIRTRFHPERHTPILGADGYFFSAGQVQPGGQDFTIVWPEKAATGQLDVIASP